MSRAFTRFCLLIPLIALVGGCITLGAKSSPATPQENRDHYSLLESSARSEAGCAYDYRVFEPDQPISSTTVLLGHGFLRDQDNLVGLSRALANRGIRVVTLDFCNMRFWNGNHELNARDMRSLMQQLGRNDIIYGGFSAGALAAVLAADEHSVAILALDLVDQNDLGARAMDRIDIPVVALHAPASSCNAYNNARALFASSDAQSNSGDETQSTLIAGASHCDFESPTNWLCELACGNTTPEHNDADAQDARTKIINKTIAGLMPILGRHKSLAQSK